MPYKERKINVLGCDVIVVQYDYASFYYPSFNLNFERKVSQKGFRELSSYIRFVRRYCKPTIII